MADNEKQVGSGDSEKGYGQFHRRVLESKSATLAFLSSSVALIAPMAVCSTAMKSGCSAA